MKKLFIIAVLFPLLSFSQADVKEFDMVYLHAKKEKVTDVITTSTKVTIFEETITVRYLEGMFVFEIVTEVPNDKDVTILLVNAIKENNVKVVFDDNDATFSFEYGDRMIMFYNKDKIEEFAKLRNK
jgi:Trk K+ transport system NAD-binding subunit